MNRSILILSTACLLTACTPGWTRTAPVTGAQFSDVEPYCREQAHLSALRQVNLDQQSGMLYPANFPSVEYRGIEDRETALCLEQHGFRKRMN